MYRWQNHKLDPLRPQLNDWVRLYNECHTTPLLHIDFLSAALKAYGTADLVLYTCRADDRLVAAAVMSLAKNFRAETFQPSQAPIGFWLQRPNIPTQELLATLARSLSPWKAVVSVTQQDPYLLPRPLPSNRLNVTDYIVTARVSVTSDWPSYLQSRGANLRQNLKKSRNKLSKLGHSIQLRLATDPVSVLKAAECYGQIESKSWKAFQGTAISPYNDQGRFYGDLLSRFSARGRARCYQLLIDDEVAASDLCVRGEQEIVILKTTYDERFKEYSPAFLMRELEFQELFREPWCKRIEFYGRAMDWHSRWTDEMRGMYHLTWFRHPGFWLLRKHGRGAALDTIAS